MALAVPPLRPGSYVTEALAEPVLSRPVPALMEQLRCDVKELDNRMLRFTEGLSVAQLDRQPGPKRWSVAQCLEHLILFDSLYFSGVEQRINAAPPAHPEARFSLRGLDKWAYNFFGEKPPFRIPTIHSFDPHFDRTYGATIVARYRDHLERLDQQFRLAEAHDVRRITVQSPALGLVRFPYPAIALIAVAHHKRHHAQAERTRAELGI